MKIIIAPDSFKESLTALEVANAIEEGLRRVYPYAQYIKIPMADGGEGTVQSLVDATEGFLVKTWVTAPLGEKILSFFGISYDHKTAFIEMAAASGLHLVPPDLRNPLKTTSYGTGELIKAALDYGVENIILGIGGSSTNDGGVGMLQALGARVLDKDHQPIGFGAQALLSIAQLDVSTLDPRLTKVSIDVACDVTNPLCGKLGASAIFAPQKGATPKMIPLLDRALAHFAKVVYQQYNLDINHRAGAGAAGGMGGGLLLLPSLRLRSGVDIIINATSLAKHIQTADLVITGEGRMDAQTISGKTPIGVARLAKQYHKPVIAIVGSLAKDYQVVYQHGIDCAFPIIQTLSSPDAILQQAKNNLITTAHNIALLYRIASRTPPRDTMQTSGQ